MLKALNPNFTSTKLSISALHGATPRRLGRKWQVDMHGQPFPLRAAESPSWASHKSIATASDSKEGGEGKTWGEKNVCPSSLSDLLWEKKTPGTKMAQLWNFAGIFLDISLLPWPKKKFPQDTKKNSLCKNFYLLFWPGWFFDIRRFYWRRYSLFSQFDCCQTFVPWKATPETHQKWIHKGIKKSSAKPCSLALTRKSKKKRNFLAK